MKKILLTGLILLIANTILFSVEAFSSDQNQKKVIELKAELIQNKKHIDEWLKSMEDDQTAKNIQTLNKLNVLIGNSQSILKLSQECGKDQQAGVRFESSDHCKKYLEMQRLLINNLNKELNIENNSDSRSVTSVLPIVLSQ